MKIRKKQKTVLFVKKMNKKTILNLVSVILILTSMLSLTFSHTGGDDAIDSTSSTILPFHYFAEGSYIQAILIIVFWVLIIKGIYELAMLIIARTIK